MKKCILILVLFFSAQLGCKIMPASALGLEATFVNPIQEDENTLVIKKVIETFLESSVTRDLDTMMSVVSKNYSTTENNKVTDYAKFKDFNEKLLKNTIDVYISDVKIHELNVTDNNATVVVEYNFKAYDLKNLKNLNLERKRKFSLSKEEGSWKIVSMAQVM